MTMTNTESVIREVLTARGLSPNDGSFAVYRDIYQTDASGRDFADYAGPIHQQDRRPQIVCTTVREAAQKLDEIRSDATLGGYRGGRIAYRPNKRETKGAVTRIGPGTAADEIALVEIGWHGDIVAAKG